MRLKTFGVILLLIVLGVGGFILRTVYLAGYFRGINSHFDGECRLIPGPIGAEDIAIDRAAGVAYISGYDRRAAMAGRPQPGAIHMYDLNAENVAPTNITPEADTSFQPHGISLWTGPDHKRVLYVINHPARGTRPYTHSVEVYDVL